MKNLLKVHRVASVIAAAALCVFANSASAEPKRIAIANFGEHPALNAAITGMKKGLAQAGFVEGKDVVYSVSHTNFDSSLVPQMVSKLQAEKPDLMFTITTPVSQIAKKALANSGLPIVFVAVTDPVAAKLVPSWTAGDEGMTGASDLQSITGVMNFAKTLMPAIKSVGFPFNPGEANDVALVEVMKAAAQKTGLKLSTVGIENVNDVQARITSLRGKADVIYLPASNLLMPATGALASAGRSIGVPVVSASDDAVRTGVVLASFAVNYEQVGFNAGVIAARILKGEKAKAIPVSVPAEKDHAMVISKRGLKEFKIALPASLANCNCLVD